MNTDTVHKLNNKSYGLQTGQAMIEYAIILMLMIVLIAGGTELGIATFNSNRTAEGAKTGANYWTETALVYNVVYDAGLTGTSGYKINAGIGLGDHTNLDETGTGFDMPFCDDGAGNLSTELPTDGDIYLYNPKIIDITDCDQDEINALFDALPPIHNSIRSLYTEQCVESDFSWKALSSCDTAAGDMRIMKLTGIITTDDTIDINVFDDNNNYVNTLPTFELECEALGTQGFANCDTRAVPNDVCWSTLTGEPLACNVRTIVRHRHLFESFVIFRNYLQDPVAEADLSQFDPGPNGFGAVGSELWRGRLRKAQRTFKGCYETNILTNTFNVAGDVYGNILSAETNSCN